MTHTYHLTRASGNKKTGPIPVSTSSRSTCPSCPLKGNGCYAEGGPLRLHWDKVSDGVRGGTLPELCDDIRHLPKHQLWRWAQAGDLPGHNDLIDEAALAQLVQANRGAARLWLHPLRRRDPSQRDCSGDGQQQRLHHEPVGQ